MQRLEPISPFENSNQPSNPVHSVNSSNISTTARTLIPFHQDTLLFMYTNADSLLNKLPELSILTADHKPHIIIVTETLPKHCLYPVQECEFQLPGYQMYTNHDRPTCKRGISAYTRNDVTATIVEILCDYNCSESLWIKIKLKHQDSILVGGIYRSPNTSPDNSGNIRTLLEMANQLKYSHIIVTGDFNMSTTNWELIQATNPMEEDLLDTIQGMYWTQHIDQPTRIRGTDTPRILDLVLTNETNMIERIEYLPPLGASDHLTIAAKLNLYTEVNQNNNHSLALNKTNFKEVCKALGEIIWEDLFQNKNIDECWSVIKNTLMGIVMEHTPTRRMVNGKPKPPWMTAETRRASKDKSKAWNRYYFTKDNDRLKDFKKIRNRTTNLIRDAKVTFERNIATNVREDPKSFWKFVRSKTKVRPIIGELKSQDGTMAITDEQKADTINKHYHQVFTKEDDTDTPTLDPRDVEDTLTTIIIQKDEVLKKLKSLKISSAAGPDNIHPRILKETQLEISGPLKHIFQLSINEGTLPRDWKDGNITPIFKKGSRTNPANYRPISLTSVVCKMLEGLL